MKAIWKNIIIADSDDTIVIENSHYFPPSSVNMDYLNSSNTTSVCPRKGLASYYDIEVNGEINKDSAWVYRDPTEEAKNIKGYIAFWKGVEVS